MDLQEPIGQTRKTKIHKLQGHDQQANDRKIRRFFLR